MALTTTRKSSSSTGTLLCRAAPCESSRCLQILRIHSYQSLKECHFLKYFHLKSIIGQLRKKIELEKVARIVVFPAGIDTDR